MRTYNPRFALYKATETQQLSKMIYHWLRAVLTFLIVELEFYYCTSLHLCLS